MPDINTLFPQFSSLNILKNEDEEDEEDPLDAE